MTPHDLFIYISVLVHSEACHCYELLEHFIGSLGKKKPALVYCTFKMFAIHFLFQLITYNYHAVLNRKLKVALHFFLLLEW